MAKAKLVLLKNEKKVCLYHDGVKVPAGGQILAETPEFQNPVKACFHALSWLNDPNWAEYKPIFGVPNFPLVPTEF